MDRLIWIDLEMTGLDPEKDAILEIATIVTNNNLEILAEGPDIAINQPKEVLTQMDEWSLTHHNASGLLNKVRQSKYNTKKAELETLDFLNIYCKGGESPLCGNTISQDRLFLKKHMPQLEAFFSYRNIDVTSIKELAKKWYPSLPEFKKKEVHLALSDILESICELRYYREKVFTKEIDT